MSSDPKLAAETRPKQVVSGSPTSSMYGIKACSYVVGCINVTQSNIREGFASE